jgi:site-specific DNA-methyltransferase (adenine-specific)
VLGDKPITRAFQSPAFERGTLDNIWRIPAQKSSDDSHRASFPLSLAETVCRNFGFDGASFFDPFLGTGTSAIAAHYGGFDFVGCELDEDYFKAAQARIERETAQGDMF